MAKRTAEDYLEALMGVADDLNFRDDESKEKWVNDHMKGAGYKPKLSWEDAPDGDNGDKDEGVSSLFGNTREKRPTRPKGDKKDWMYG